jgi:hypothetical protein
VIYQSLTGGGILVTRHEEDAALARLPAVLRSWLLYQDIGWFSAVNFLQIHEAGWSEEKILDVAASRVRSLTKAAYGSAHPQARGERLPLAC